MVDCNRGDMGKVMFIINDGIYPYRTGGMEVFNYHLIRALSNDMPIAYMATCCYDFDQAEFVNSCAWKPTKFFAPLWAFIYLIFHKEYRQVVFSFSAAHWMVWKIYTLAIKMLRRDAVVVIHYGKDVPEDHYDVYREFFHRAQTVVAVSEDIKNNYDAHYGIDCKVIYPLIPFKKSPVSKSDLRERYSIPQNANVIVMVGSLKPMKNPQMILKSLGLFDTDELERYRPFLLYAGEGIMREELERMAGIQGLGDYVKFLGVVSNDKVCEIMMMADIYLISSDFEGTSVSLLEAMYNSMPIIASDVPGLKDMIKSEVNGILYDVGSPEELKQAVIRLVEDKELARRLGSAARESYDKRYDYDDMLKQYKRLLEDR